MSDGEHEPAQAVEQLQARGIIKPEEVAIPHAQCKGSASCTNAAGWSGYCGECYRAACEQPLTPEPMRPCVECRHHESAYRPRLGADTVLGTCGTFVHPVTGERRDCMEIREKDAAGRDYLPCPKFAAKECEGCEMLAEALRLAAVEVAEGRRVSAVGIVVEWLREANSVVRVLDNTQREEALE